MTKSIELANCHIRCHRLDVVIIGSGAASLSAAEYLARRGEAKIAVVTEGMAKGTSRNTGSDKQTYYKLNLCGNVPDSVRGMAECLFSGGCMDGDIALVEAALSARGFFRLVELGVPFPHNSSGEYVGYKTDHDPAKRGSSAGPLTSHYMTEYLQQAVEQLGVTVFDKMQVIEILTRDGDDEKVACGVVALDLDNLDDPNKRYVVFLSENIIYGTGSEAGMYERSVYPPSQTGTTGAAFRAGVMGKNLTESQYGIASVKFRWNLSGTYQQVLPRYISTAPDGTDEREFLEQYFSTPATMLSAIFLKGYQWPFDPRKTDSEGSSLIDIAVHEEMENGRRVFLDFRKNPSCAEREGHLRFDQLDEDVTEYLENSGATQSTPFERLAHMNPAAVHLYRSHNIDLETELLEIAVCAQHNNGGLSGDHWWQSNIRGFFPVGEVNGTHGIYRPGGSALNSGQVGSMRAVDFIIHNKPHTYLSTADIVNACTPQMVDAVSFGESALTSGATLVQLPPLLHSIQRRMSRYGAHIRSRDTVRTALNASRADFAAIESISIASPTALPLLHKVRDAAVCQHVYLFAILDYIENGGGSRGSYIVQHPEGKKPHPLLPDTYCHLLDDGTRADRVQEVVYQNGNCTFTWRKVRPIPPENEWFETVWREYATGTVFTEKD